MHKMIRVANVIMDGRLAGAQIRIMSVAKNLKEKGIETVVIFPLEDSDNFYKKLSENGIAAQRLNLHYLTRQKSHLIKYIFLFIPELLRLYRFIKKERFDLVHCNGSWQIKGVIAGKLAGAKVIWHLNDTKMPAFIRIMFNALYYLMCDAIIVAGERVKLYYLNYKRIDGKPVMTIQAPVDTAIFNPIQVEANQRIAQYNGVKIVTVANINPIKGIDIFIKMASILNKEYDGLHFFIIGPHLKSQEKYVKELSEMIKKLKLTNVQFYEQAENVASILKAADIYVCSSIAEASPTSVWEAMSMARPVVSTDVADVSSFITNGESGFVVPVKAPDALAEKIKVLIDNKALRDKMGENARNMAIRHLDINICTDRHAEIYKSMV